MSIASPCNSVCKMDSKSRLCIGCWRTLDEIVAWSSDTDASKKKVCALIELRKNEAKKSNAIANGMDKSL